MTAAQLAKQLQAAGIAVGKVTEPDDLEDGEIVLADTLRVQVGPGYFCLALNLPEGNFRYFHSRRRINALLNDLRSLAQDPALEDLPLRQALSRVSLQRKE